MTDDLDPDDAAVRRLLADARHTGPMPDDVAARMDAVLADLAAEAPAEPKETPPPAAAPAPLHPVVVSLDVRRRRRAAGMLVAAAAIVIGGVVVAQHLPTSTSQSNSATAQDDAGSRALDGVTGSSPGPLTPGTSPRAEAAKIRAGRVVVSPQRFTADALAARRLVRQRALSSSSFADLSQARAACVGQSVRGRRVGATYQGAPAVLVFHAPQSGTQVVDLYVCGSGRPVRSTTLPAP